MQAKCTYCAMYTDCLYFICCALTTGTYEYVVHMHNIFICICSCSECTSYDIQTVYIAQYVCMIHMYIIMNISLVIPLYKQRCSNPFWEARGVIVGCSNVCIVYLYMYIRPSWISRLFRYLNMAVICVYSYITHVIQCIS